MIDPLVEQLWGGAIESRSLRVDNAGSRWSPEPGWRESERYYVVPNSTRPTMLLPAGPRRALLGALTNYRGLRPPRRQVQRRLLTVPAAAGYLPCPQVVLSVPESSQAAVPSSPLGELAGALGRQDLRAAIGIRTSANRKATLQLVDVEGAPVGFAKFSWSDETALAVRREAAALSAGTGKGVCRRPALLASGTYSGWPYLVTSPLPLSSRAVRGKVAPPTIQEFHDLAPNTGARRLATTDHFIRLCARLQALVNNSADIGRLASRALQVLDAAGADDRELMVTKGWHGDLTPWNAARDADGRLWVWDWESTEPDSVAGLDVLHWHLSLSQDVGRRLDATALDRAVERARPVLSGLGHPRSAVPLVTAVYVAALVERALALCVFNGGWETGWLSSEDVDDLLGHVTSTLSGALL